MIKPKNITGCVLDLRKPVINCLYINIYYSLLAISEAIGDHFVLPCNVETDGDL